MSSIFITFFHFAIASSFLLLGCHTHEPEFCEVEADDSSTQLSVAPSLLQLQHGSERITERTDLSSSLLTEEASEPREDDEFLTHVRKELKKRLPEKPPQGDRTCQNAFDLNDDLVKNAAKSLRDADVQKWLKVPQPPDTTKNIKIGFVVFISNNIHNIPVWKAWLDGARKDNVEAKFIVHEYSMDRSASNFSDILASWPKEFREALHPVREKTGWCEMQKPQLRLAAELLDDPQVSHVMTIDATASLPVKPLASMVAALVEDPRTRFCGDWTADRVRSEGFLLMRRSDVLLHFAQRDLVTQTFWGKKHKMDCSEEQGFYWPALLRDMKHYMDGGKRRIVDTCQIVLQDWRDERHDKKLCVHRKPWGSTMDYCNCPTLAKSPKFAAASGAHPVTFDQIEKKAFLELWRSPFWFARKFVDDAVDDETAKIAGRTDTLDDKEQDLRSSADLKETVQLAKAKRHDEHEDEPALIFPSPPAAYSALLQVQVGGPSQDFMTPMSLIAYDSHLSREMAVGLKMAALLGLIVLVLVAMSPILFRDGVCVYLICGAQLTCLVTTQLLVKKSINSGFHDVLVITLFHFICTAVIAGILDKPNLQHGLRVVPAAMVSSLAIIAGNLAMTQGGVGFVAMLGSCVSVVTFVVAFCLGIKVTMKEGMAAVIISVGGALCVKGETHATLICVLFALAGVIMKSLKLIWQHELLQLQMSALQLSFWTCTLGIVFSIPMLIYDKEAAVSCIAKEYNHPSIALVYVGLSTVTAVTLNINGAVLLRALGPVFYSVVSVLSFLMIEMLAVVWLKETIHRLQICGMLLLVLGPAVAKLECFPGSKEAERNQENSDDDPIEAKANLKADVTNEAKPNLNGKTSTVG
eukprot:TRINITY_DN30029_c2_g1_i1.p1 TRINITY_DN30029_c2_g1~~TRINITY_DN30029_c2_g1_i1.p1  ORF type:complete len:865 (+),score=111.07 TRINITY_DN30029_c2_g1_i1:155-2749(+)